MGRLRAVLIATTQWFNAALGGNPDQTFSGRTALEAEQGSYFAIVREAAIDLFFAIACKQRHHCANSVERDEV
jgi:hypothetical protein